eukprot:7624822-Lingulodinium_polyedra.AAC.1
MAAHEFLKVDFAEMRVKAMRAEVPPPGLEQRWQERGPVEVNEPQECACAEVDAMTGEKCKEVFGSMRALALHRWRKHGKRCE